MNHKNEYTNNISFPLGGIGTGSIGIAGNGRFTDWEIFNRPSKGSANGYSHFAIKAIQNNCPITYVLQGDLNTDLIGQYEKMTFGGFGFGPRSNTMCGFPHFKNVEFNGEFPIATLDFKDEDFPADIKLTAFNPFIPGDADNSSIPAAFFEIEVNNTTDKITEYQIALSVANPYKEAFNKIETIDGRQILMLCNGENDKENIKYGDLAIAADCDDVQIQTYWFRGAWQDNIVTFWNDFNSIEKLRDRQYDDNGHCETGTIAAAITVSPWESKKVRFVLSWNVPNNYNYWDEDLDENGNHKQWKNYYATMFENSAVSAAYALENWDSLYSRTLLFKNTLYNSTLPEEVKDAAASNLSVLKSPTVLRLEDGSFYGWEGVHEENGSCEGTCQHVWNYAYALCFLFPKLERSIRDLEFKYSTDTDGRMGFRLRLPLGRKMTDFRACLDGQMGAVIKSYREWKLSGDSKWLADNWENIKKVLEYAWSKTNKDAWDADKDGVLEGRQHHTLDMELFGSSSWLEGMYLAALKAAAEMAVFLGDTAKAKEYEDLYCRGKKWTKENLFNGKYFIQKIDISDKSITDRFDASETYWNNETNEIKYQIEEGSSIDQMLAQWHADILGLGDIFDSVQISSALDEMMKHNYKPTMREFVNPWRIFSLNDEAGSVICAYPENSRKPKIPISYCEETMTGFEYSFAGLLCSRGKIENGLKVVKAVRDRFDGKKRNPWNEFECGSNYARSMASYALIPILSGFEFDLPNGHIGFNPYRKGDFSIIWSVDGAWGEFEIVGNSAVLIINEGELKLKSFGAKFCETISELIIDGKKIDFEFKDGSLKFDELKICRSLEFKQ